MVSSLALSHKSLTAGTIPALISRFIDHSRLVQPTPDSLNSFDVERVGGTNVHNILSSKILFGQLRPDLTKRRTEIQLKCLTHSLKLRLKLINQPLRRLPARCRLLLNLSAVLIRPDG